MFDWSVRRVGMSIKKSSQCGAHVAVFVRPVKPGVFFPQNKLLDVNENYENLSPDISRMSSGVLAFCDAARCVRRGLVCGLLAAGLLLVAGVLPAAALSITRTSG